MKKVIALLLFGFITIIIACKGNKNQNIIAGKWKPVTVDLKNMSDSEKKGLLNNVRMEFTSNGNFYNIIKGDTVSGTYVYDERSKVLSVNTKAGEGGTQEFTITWENNMMIMTNEEGTVKLKQQ